MATQYVYDENGFLIGVVEGDGHPNSTTIQPDYVDGKTPQFVNGAWVTGNYALLTPMQFYVSFTAMERIKLKALATTGIPASGETAAIPVDPIIEEFWATYQMSVQAGAHIDPNLTSTQEALGYLANPTAPTPAVITADRIPQILNGVAQ